MLLSTAHTHIILCPLLLLLINSAHGNFLSHFKRKKHKWPLCFAELHRTAHEQMRLPWECGQWAHNWIELKMEIFYFVFPFFNNFFASACDYHISSLLLLFSLAASVLIEIKFFSKFTNRNSLPKDRNSGNFPIYFFIQKISTSRSFVFGSEQLKISSFVWAASKEKHISSVEFQRTKRSAMKNNKISGITNVESKLLKQTNNKFFKMYLNVCVCVRRAAAPATNSNWINMKVIFSSSSYSSFNKIEVKCEW